MLNVFHLPTHICPLPPPPCFLPQEADGYGRTTSTLVDLCPLAYSWVQPMGDTGRRVAQEGRGWGINILSSLSFSFSFYSPLQWIGRGPPKLGRAIQLLSLAIQMVSSPRNTLTDTLRIMFPQVFGYPVSSQFDT